MADSIQIIRILPKHLPQSYLQKGPKNRGKQLDPKIRISLRAKK